MATMHIIVATILGLIGISLLRFSRCLGLMLALPLLILSSVLWLPPAWLGLLSLVLLISLVIRSRRHKRNRPA